MSPIPRPALAAKIIACDPVPSVHHDCVAPGVAVREIRPPLTELSPIPESFPAADLPDPEANSPFEPGESITRLLMSAAHAPGFTSAEISQSQLWNLVRCAFRWGTSYPLFPEGPHVALIRPLWVLRQVTGFEPGAWYFNPVTDAWSLLRPGVYKSEIRRLVLGNAHFDQAAATCFLIANLYRLMSEAGPDLYRLAHLESGAAIQRLDLAARAINLSTIATTAFADDDTRRFFGLDRTFWHPLAVAALGSPSPSITAQNRDRETRSRSH